MESLKEKYFLVLTCSLALLFFAGNGFAEEHHGGKNGVSLPMVKAHVQQVKESAIVPQIELVATIQAVQQAAIAAKVTGTITQLPLVLGQRVKQGEVLLKISAEEISARVQQAQAQLAQAKRNLEREKKLLKRSATTRETVKSMEDMYAVAKASFHEARTMLGYTTISAPFDGVITRKMVNSGDLATPGIPLVTLEDDSRLQAVTAVPESLIIKLRQGEKLDVVVPSAQVTVSGIVAEIAPSADPLSRTAQVKINLAADNALRTGQFARVILSVDAVSTVLIPQSAVVPRGQMDRVFVVENGKAWLRLVRVGRRLSGQVEILAGLRVGEEIIVDNNELIVSGQPISQLQ